jgi:hypothetical protein
MNQSDELCLSYFANWQKMKEITQEMRKFVCPRTLLRVPGCPHPQDGTVECYCQCQQSHITDSWQATKDGGYDSEEAIECRSAVDACPECSRYQSIVDERRALRRGLGVVKSSICKRGKRLEAESKAKP